MIAMRATWGGFPAASRALSLAFGRRIEADRDKGWHVEGLAQRTAAAAADALAGVAGTEANCSIQWIGRSTPHLPAAEGTEQR